MSTSWDCIVVGGGAAGLSAALVLGRARRRTLLVDAGRQSNLAAHGIGGMLGQDGRAPAAFYAAAREEIAAYPSVEIRDGEVTGGARDEGGFVLDLADGGRETTRTVLLATGMDYRAPTLPGVAERWGRSVFHCPFCHGWEVRERPLGMLGNGAANVHRALLLRMWSDDVTLLTDGPADLDSSDAERLRQAGITIDERPVRALRGPEPDLEAIVFADGSERPCGGLLVPAPLHQRDGLAGLLGAGAAAPSPIAVDALEVDPMLQTTADGVMAAGDLTGRMPSVANSVAAGATAAAMVVGRLAGAL